MQPRRPGLSLLAALLLAALAAAGPALADSPQAEGLADPCSEDFVPPNGAVSQRRVTRVAARQVTKVLAEEAHKLRCRRKEPEARCLARARARWIKRAGSRQLTIQMVASDGKVEASLKVDGVPLVRKFRDYKQLAGFMQARMVRGKEVVLLAARQLKDRTRRMAQISLRRMVTEELPPTLKVAWTWRPGQKSEMHKNLIELQFAMERSGRFLSSFEVVGLFEVRMVVQCPDPQEKPPK